MRPADSARPSPSPRRATATDLRLFGWMALAIVAVTAVAWWDSRRESEALLQDVAREQLVVARAAAPVVKAQLRDGRHSAEGTVRGILPAIEIPGELRLLLGRPGAGTLLGSDGAVVSSPALQAAIDEGRDTARLTRAEAALIGLDPRTAMAGIAYVDAPSEGRWALVSVETAARQRDRESRAFWRLVLGVAMAVSLVFAFGGAALRSQRRRLAAEHELAVAGALQKRDDALARAERVATMGTFAMGIVHEVASPLAVILGRAEQLLAPSHSDERRVVAAQAIIEQVDRIQLVVRRFLDLARGGPPALSECRAADVVRSAAASVDHRLAKAGVALSIDAPDDLPSIQCDRALLEQALVNLLLNASDACAPGGHVEIAARADGHRVGFFVTDDGAGIRPEDAARATEPFFTTKPSDGGTGLGLAIASEIAKTHRGELRIGPHAEKGKGTLASIEIPSSAALRGGAGATV